MIAIPVQNEASRVAGCLQAIASQHPRMPRGALHVLLFANGCTDETAQWLFGNLVSWPMAATVIEARLPPSEQSAGQARRLANHAAVALAEPDGLLFMTDADSCVPADWIDAYSAMLRSGWDAVAGAVDIRVDDRDLITGTLDQRNQLEARYTALLDEMESEIDPLSHDPWPRHFNASGANLAVSLAAMRRLRDFPDDACGEDRALIRNMEAHDLRVRHDTRTRVLTSGRLFGRATGGMADTLRHRTHVPDAPCDRRLEPAHRACLRASLRAKWRAIHSRIDTDIDDACELLREFALLAGLGERMLRDATRIRTFGASWHAIESAVPHLAAAPLTPSLLPLEIRRANDLLSVARRGIVPAWSLEMSA